MAASFTLEIVTPERKFFSGEVTGIVLKTLDGEIGVLAGHQPMVLAVNIGPVRIQKSGEWIEAFLSEGYMEITPEKTILLVDTAEWPEEIDANRAEAARRRAEERLTQQLSQSEFVNSQASLARAMERLRVKSRAQGHMTSKGH